MEQELRFGLDLGRLAVLNKRVCADYDQHLRVVFFMFSGGKNVKFFSKTLCIRAKKLHKMKLKEYFLNFYRLGNIFNFLCSARDTSPRDFSIMTRLRTSLVSSV